MSVQRPPNYTTLATRRFEDMESANDSLNSNQSIQPDQSMFTRQTALTRIAEPSSGSTSPLLALPPELRANIWQLAFAPDNDEEINLLGATEPCKNLLITNRQVRDEASQFYSEAREQFWPTTHFFIANRKRGKNDNVPISTAAAIEAFNDTTMGKIRHLTLRSPKLNFTFTNGVWRCIGPCKFGCEGGRRLRGVPPGYGFACPSPAAVWVKHEQRLKSLDTIGRRLDAGPRLSINPESGKRYWFLQAEEFVSEEEDLEAMRRAAGWTNLTKEELREMVRWHWADSYDPRMEAYRDDLLD